MRALIVDDSRTIRAILRGILVRAGFEIEEAGNGVEALERLRLRARPDVVLVDWNMPEMDGITFLTAVRADPAWRDLPIVMITTEMDEARLIQARTAGANEYIAKPFVREAVLERLERLGLAVSCA
jgi:two-component system, chemotaxis family, chemotaxis protein CheY